MLYIHCRGVVRHGCTGAYAPAEILVHPSSERPFSAVRPSSERPYRLCTRPVKILTAPLPGTFIKFEDFEF